MSGGEADEAKTKKERRTLIAEAIKGKNILQETVLSTAEAETDIYEDISSLLTALCIYF